MRIKATLALTALSVLCAIAPAKAATFIYEDSASVSQPVTPNNKAGKYTDIKAIFDDQTNILNWSSTFARNNKGKLADGAWLVLSDGPNPKNHLNEYAIMYLDSLEEKVSIYNYDGNNNANSYKGGTYLGSVDLDVDDSVADEVTFSFDLDATNINSYSDPNSDWSNWEGVTFGKEIGIWFHSVAGLDADYDSNGKLLSFGTLKGGKTGYYDAKDLDTTKVPEPGSVAALGLFGAVAATKLRKRIG
ncbi:PEP-CTERM sorting domain-containing protein [cf. Phormidesmis sp. LEGE 11477]|uniref:PEP-CTERM sorting domain-containing protein n=1 Tax=cf. Phormidesmis sp. LEGE 11477 TaxID=1828680 RepID=UPI0018801451|nr:PEP-CTERM sorting domain-containing protein [cf. Phormidesmis sp. LEGE 11477]MBE9060945.1 PEP-CTERM sorting domain-containing protein [cf. Phormidesmis sp. LEGE 11477]